MKRLLLLSVLLTSFVSNAQSLSREVIGSGGGTYHGENRIIRQTIGQPSSTTVETEEDFTLRQGFQQPLSFSFYNTEMECDFILSPNPSTGIFNVDLPIEYGKGTLNVITMDGKELSKEEINTGITEHRLTDLPQGVYLVRVVTEEGYICEKRAVINN